VHTECLYRILVLGEAHLRRVLDAYVDHYYHQLARDEYRLQ
jgi:hypothetical protein